VIAVGPGLGTGPGATAFVHALVERSATTLVLDADGRETTRASGAPRKADVLAALGHAVR